MNLDEENFLEEIERVEALPAKERKAFYVQVLEKETKKTTKRLLAYFYYALQFYREGDFKRTREILEPFVIDYQSYEFIPQMIACFNLMGVASHCEREYKLSRFFYKKGAMLARTYGERSRLSYEYNNIALSYIAEQKYEEALQHICHAEEHLYESDEEMGAYIYVNMAVIYLNLDRLELASAAFEKCIGEYRAMEIIPDDVLVCGIRLYNRLGEKEKYSSYQKQIMEKLENMYAPEFIDASKAIFDCGMCNRDFALVEEILEKMDAYLRRYPHEDKVGLNIEECRYLYAKEIGRQDIMIEALLRKNAYYRRIRANAEERHIEEFEQYFRINRQLQEAVENEAHANRVKTQFLANMSNDIRTPINGIMGMLQVIRECKDAPEKVEDCLKKMDISARHLLSLVNDVLNMTKQDKVSKEKKKEPLLFQNEQREKVEEEAESESLQEMNLTGKKLLLVEDNELNMEIAEFILVQCGADIDKAANGKEGLEYYLEAADGTYDLILMDLMMPVMDGYEAAKAIRASGKKDASVIPIIAMSANTYVEDVEKCMEVGMNAHISKPIFRDVFIKTIRQHVK